MPYETDGQARNVWETLYMLTSSMDLTDLNNHRCYVTRIGTWEIKQVILAIRHEMWRKVKYWQLVALVNKINTNVAGIVTQYLHSLYVEDFFVF